MLVPDTLEDDDLHDYYSDDESGDTNDDSLSLESLVNSDRCYKITYNAEKLGISDTVVILDTAAGDSLFRNKDMLNNLTETTDIVKFDGVDQRGAGIYTCTEGETIFGNVMFSERSMGNILSFGNVVDDCYRVTYMKNGDMFLIQPTSESDTYVFQRDKDQNIYICDTHNVLTSVPMGVNTVAENMNKYTRREIRKALKAREYLKNSDYMSAGQLINCINRGKIKNCEVSAQDVLRSIDIWGKDLGNLKGKTTARKLRGVENTKLERTLSVAANQDMHIDLMFVNGVPYMIALFQPLDLAVAKRLKAQNELEQWRVLQLLMRHVTKGGVKIWRIRCDGESAIHSDYIIRKLPDGVILDHTVVVADLERKIRTVKE